MHAVLNLILLLWEHILGGKESRKYFGGSKNDLKLYNKCLML